MTEMTEMTEMRNNAPQKGTYIAHRHVFDRGALQLRGHCFATEPWLYAAGARAVPTNNKQEKKMQ